MPNLLLLFAVIAVLTALLTAGLRRYVLRRRWLDVPNARSSHHTPTPRGGGLAIAAAFFIGLVWLYVAGQVDPALFIALAGGGVLLTAVGAREDRVGLSLWLRLGAQTAAAAWALFWLNGAAVGHAGPEAASGWAGWVGQGAILLALVWCINLYNFMDGIDGLAAGEAVSVAFGSMLLLGWGHDVSQVWLVLAAAGLGFLHGNWPPAKIFMGDAGSYFLGFVIATLALACTSRQLTPLWCWPILLGVFVVDASVTLARRVLNGQPWWRPHRSHAYQRAVRRLGRHRPVTVAVLFINGLWLTPWALAAVHWPQWAVGFTGAALLPLVLLVLGLRAGKADADY